MLTQNCRETLRTLAIDLMEIANNPMMEQKKTMWKALNRNNMQRPMVVIDQLPWNELDCTELHITISDPYWQIVERTMRQTIYMYRHFPVDMVIDPFIKIPKVVSNSGYGLIPNEKIMGMDNANIYSHKYRNLITNFDDVKLITDMTITYEEAETNRYLDEANDMFFDIAPVKAYGIVFSLGVWDYLSQLMSVESIYYDLIDRPELLHVAINRLTEATIAGIEQASSLNVHNDNSNVCHCSYIYTDELLPKSGAGKGGIAKNCWAPGLAQLFTSVSNDVFKEFELPYITRMANMFGMIYYGCCDKIDHRLNLVKKIPNVRKISCSPWSDKIAFAEKIGQEHIMSIKPNPSFLAESNFDEDIVRKDITETCMHIKKNNVNAEFILKDVSTVHFEPERLTRWANVAMDVVNNI